MREYCMLKSIGQTKRIFDGTQESSFLQFGRSGDTDRSKGVLKGRVSLTRPEIKSIFDGVINSIVESVIRLVGTRKVQVGSHNGIYLSFLTCDYFVSQYILLVGGFGESPYLRTRLRAVLHSYIPEIVAVDEPSYVLISSSLLHYCLFHPPLMIF